MDNLVLIFDLERETKNTYRYKEKAQGNGQPPRIGTLYISKWAVGDDPPPSLKVTIQQG